MNTSTHPNLHAQRGLSLTGLMALLAIFGMVALMAAKVFPTFLEYRSSRVGIIAAKATNGTVKQMQDAFDRTADINAIAAITGKDLMFAKDTGETEVSFSYDKEIPLFTNVKLVIHYEATTDPKGTIPERSTEPAR